MPADHVITHPRFYLRCHGEKYSTNHSAETLQETPESLQKTAKTHQLERVYVYFKLVIPLDPEKSPPNGKEKVNMEVF